ncbi:hypothetical protein [Sphingomonas trueperi]|uniref:Uncharacterized protein n=1 Tax=Sphingomonas trueperi TaxID=53317 RepID=A0A7X5Y389_9SPHN|nr:hypothetical protein [Sphingomonas trueperi]NJB99853.1 hypothetical protein [Sphingomonas trueperi]
MTDIATSLDQYLASRETPDTRTVAEVYGTENFCHLLHALIRMWTACDDWSGCIVS